MEQAKRLTEKSSLPAIVPVQLPETTAATILHVLHNIVETDNEVKSPEAFDDGVGTQASQAFGSMLQV